MEFDSTLPGSSGESSTKTSTARRGFEERIRHIYLVNRLLAAKELLLPAVYLILMSTSLGGAGCELSESLIIS